MNGVFIGEQTELATESWRLLTRQKSEIEKYRDKQKEILRRIHDRT
jgi:hypothetical protein